MKKICLLSFCCFAFLRLPLWATWHNTQTATGGWSSGSPESAYFPSALTNPSLIIVAAESSPDYSLTIPTPTDSAGNTFYDCGTGVVPFNSSFQQGVACFYALNTHTTTDGVQINNPNEYHIAIIIEEWTGGATISPVDGTPASIANANSGGGGGQNLSVGPISPTHNGDLIIGVAGTASGGTTVTAGTNFTANTERYTADLEYLVQVSAGSISATWHDSTNNDGYGAIVVAFKAASRVVTTFVQSPHSSGWTRW